MNRRELARLGWRENSLAYLEKHLQGYKDPQAYQEQYQSVFFFASPLFQNMWFQEIKDLTETAAQDLLRGVMKILLMPSDLSGTCMWQRTAARKDSRIPYRRNCTEMKTLNTTFTIINILVYFS